MKFPRNAKILRSHFDVAPFAAVFFLLLIFLMLGALVPTSGIPLHPPSAANLPGPNTPTVDMAVDSGGNLYYDNEIVSERILTTELIVKKNAARTPITMVIHADQNVSYSNLVHLTLLARNCGITNVWLATLPSVEDKPAKP